MYLSHLLNFSYDIYCKSVRLFVCSCSCCDGKCIVQEIAERILFFFYCPLTPRRQTVSEVCSCCWFATSWLRRWSRSFMRISCFLRCGRKRRLDLCTVSAAPCRWWTGTVSIELHREFFVDHKCSQVTVMSRSRLLLCCSAWSCISARAAPVCTFSLFVLDTDVSNIKTNKTVQYKLPTWTTLMN